MILDNIVEDKKRRLMEQKKEMSESKLIDLASLTEGTAHCFLNALKKDEISIIGEFKRASPSLGKIKSKINLYDRVEEYNESVDAISCLTEEDHFLGSTDDLKIIKSRSFLPVLRKDFMIDTYQFYEAKAIAADAVLLIAAILDDAELHDFYQLSQELGLDVLLEVHDEAELERALRINPKIIGINNRNLNNFSVSLQTTAKLSGRIPPDKIIVAESGILNDADVAFLKSCKVDAFLIGRAFMETEHPKTLAARWKRL